MANGPTIALIAAAGSGSRMGGDTPKQYLSVGGMPILRRSVQAFLNHPEVDAVYVVINPGYRRLYDQAIEGLDLPEPIIGGGTRQESVRRALEHLERLPNPPYKVLIHDAARPFVGARIISDVVHGLDEKNAIIPALPVRDTLKRVQFQAVTATVERADLWQAQTPQGFRFYEILEAHRIAAAQGKQFTDDAAINENVDIVVHTVLGAESNFKITTQEDLEKARQLVAQRGETRVGNGFDVHRYLPVENRVTGQVMICGVGVPSIYAVEAHSDGDVGLHALVDALLGTIGAGDIGDHFPPTDTRWKNADSSMFLAHAARMVRDQGGIIGNVDVTLMCETPKITPHKEAMRDRIASILQIAPQRVSVKATTTEKLGFLGRGEGIAAQATATVTLYGELDEPVAA
ncbi:MAG: bifunctional 2-C-methyl-D-erythritol 4-phosphate cytidylyltransferase/2-C-methyl-D-erythritol 2,4-cyclodiphosphate synthase [Alphaproteobacteria bacterium]|nr:bifunctional 2-C-methyl-D-erythritol 4-phosphate cytidylyltransferase/2-C-methyl-D-erythritol 2,4-cyclodiphosphate synthase [Alphaproteobacteria bacterium]